MLKLRKAWKTQKSGMVVVGLVGTLVGALWACGAERATVAVVLDSNTNWMRSCGPTLPCEGGLECLCGVCSQPCAADTECGGLTAAACGPALCGEASASGGMCQPECTTAAQCSVEQTCEGGFCKPINRSGEVGSARDLPPVGPAPVLPKTGSCLGETLIFDNTLRTVLSDLNARDADDQPFVRYLTVANQINAGWCEEDLRASYNALSKLLNSVSTEGALRAPEPIDGAGALFAIDMRDYGFDVPHTVGGTFFSDAWEAVVANVPTATEFEGDQADQVKQLSTARVPLLALDAFVHAVASGPLYYGLLNIPDTVDGWLAGLAVDVVESRSTRAVTTRAPLTGGEQRWERRDFPGGGVIWRIFDVQGNEPSAFQDPLANSWRAGHAVFTLPNRLRAYVAFEDDRIVAESSTQVDPWRSDLVARPGVSFFELYRAGLPTVVDELRPFVTANPSAYSPETVTLVTALYPGRDAFAEVVTGDNLEQQRLLRTLGFENFDDFEREPINVIDLAYERPLDRVTMAGELGLTPQQLSDFSVLLAPEFSGAELSRARFEELYRDALCTLGQHGGRTLGRWLVSAKHGKLGK
jgi:hypothetical protein